MPRRARCRTLSRCSPRRTAAHGQVVAIAVLAIIVYPIGLLVLCAVLLVHARAAIRPRRETALSGAIAFLWRDYDPHFLFWEVVDLGRKLFLASLVLFIQTDTGSSKLLRLVVAPSIALCRATPLGVRV